MHVQYNQGGALTRLFIYRQFILIEHYKLRYLPSTDFTMTTIVQLRLREIIYGLDRL